jgi:hypothetical protein
MMKQQSTYDLRKNKARSSAVPASSSLRKRKKLAQPFVPTRDELDDEDYNLAVETERAHRMSLPGDGDGGDGNDDEEYANENIESESDNEQADNTVASALNQINALPTAAEARERSAQRLKEVVGARTERLLQLILRDLTSSMDAGNTFSFHCLNRTTSSKYGVEDFLDFERIQEFTLKIANEKQYKVYNKTFIAPQFARCGLLLIFFWDTPATTDRRIVEVFEAPPRPSESNILSPPPSSSSSAPPPPLSFDQTMELLVPLFCDHPSASFNYGRGERLLVVGGGQEKRKQRY